MRSKQVSDDCISIYTGVYLTQSITVGGGGRGFTDLRCLREVSHAEQAVFVNSLELRAQHTPGIGLMLL